MKALRPSESPGSKANDGRARIAGTLPPPGGIHRVSFGYAKGKPEPAKGSCPHFINRNNTYSFPGSHTHFWPTK